MLALVILIATSPEPSQLLDAGAVTITKWTYQKPGLALAGAIDEKKTRVIYTLRGEFDVSIEAGPPQRLLEGEVLYLTPGLRYALTADARAHLATPPIVITFDVTADEGTNLDVRSLKIRTAEHVNHTIAGGAGTAAVLLDRMNLGHGSFALSRLTMRAGAEVPRHVHESADEILLAVEGEAFMLVAGKAAKLVAGEAVRIPKGTEHSARVPKRFTALQIYAPSGPEQRFKSAPVAGPAK
ncbi:MAG: cupin domain-containing protein [Deltaproteobacteria bacterium]|nr:cupin domain-containing protein [Deltaproteobacteria bacterium]